MINNNMPRASSQGWTPMLDESPVCMLVDNNKNFFDFADVDILDNDDKEQAVPANLIVVEDFTLPTTEDMEISYTVIDSTNILSLGGGTEGVEEEEEEDDASVDNRNIPTTALEMVNCETVPLSETQHASASFLSANLPAPLGTQPSPSPCPPTTTTTTTSSPFQLPCTPPYPHPPSTPSGYSTCSGDDVASTSSSEQLTPEVSGVTSGRKFLIPMPSDDRMAAAALSALETCSLTPLIKEELKYTIQSRRLAAGKPELVVDTKPPVKVQKVVSAGAFCVEHFVYLFQPPFPPPPASRFPSLCPSSTPFFSHE